MPSSAVSSPCRLELRPSRWPIVALSAMAVVAPWSLWLSALPEPWFWALAPLSAACALWLARREARRPRRELLIAFDGAVSVDGVAVEAFAIAWRGPLAFLTWREPSGARRGHSLWPDTLPPARRRELRLAAAAALATGRKPGPVAP